MHYPSQNYPGYQDSDDLGLGLLDPPPLQPDFLTVFGQKYETLTDLLASTPSTLTQPLDWVNSSPIFEELSWSPTSSVSPSLSPSSIASGSDWSPQTPGSVYLDAEPNTALHAHNSWPEDAVYPYILHGVIEIVDPTLIAAAENCWQSAEDSAPGDTEQFWYGKRLDEQMTVNPKDTNSMYQHEFSFDDCDEESVVDELDQSQVASTSALNAPPSIADDDEYQPPSPQPHWSESFHSILSPPSSLPASSLSSSSSPPPSSPSTSSSSLELSPTSRDRHPCKKCERTFSRPADVGRHLKTVHADRANLAKCPNCSYSYSREDAYKRHKRTCHTNPRRVLLVEDDNEDHGGCTARKRPSRSSKHRKSSKRQKLSE